FGKFSGDVLVGNFGDGRIHAYRATADGWEAHGVVKGTDHRPISIDGLWGLGFGNNAAAGPATTLFFAAGPDDETKGEFGSITAPSHSALRRRCARAAPSLHVRSGRSRAVRAPRAGHDEAAGPPGPAA